jgi:exopolysaccharide biosynthesis polyprenyl glycosylphosphotransferase
VLGELDQLSLVLLEHEIDRVVIAPGPLLSEDVLNLIRLVKYLGVKVSLIPSLFEVVGSSVEFDDLGGMTVLGLRRYGLQRSSTFIKRSMDVVMGGTVLVLASPLLAVIAAAIRVDSRGSVLFRQPRTGARGREFQILKFRTMISGAEKQKGELGPLNEADGLFKIADDPRVTRVGRFLRRTSLDELPQLINVLRGEMSLVGPRPLVSDEDSRVEGWDRRRLEMRPGMTGHWQVLGSARIPLSEMVKIDYMYGANWSLWGDLKILFRTVPFVLARRGI